MGNEWTYKITHLAAGTYSLSDAITHYNCAPSQGIVVVNSSTATVTAAGLSNTLDSKQYQITKVILPSDNTDITAFTAAVKFNDALYTGTYTTSADSSNTSHTMSKGQVSVKNGETVTIPYVPSDYSAAVTETPPAGWILSGITSAEDAGNNTITYTITNIKTASLTATVNWLDNGSDLRPSSETEKGNLNLYYLIGDAKDPVKLTADNCSDVGLLSVPAPADSSGTADGIDYYSYTYGSLPLATSEGKNITWSIAQDTAPDAYISAITTNSSDASNIKAVIANTLKMSFNAKIVWNDNATKATSRPDKVTLKLHRYSTTTADEIYKENIEVSGNNTDSTWSISEADLPLYDSKGNQFIYYAVEAPVTSKQDGITYNTTYDNGTGTYGTETEKAYEGGSVENTINATASANFKKEWKDNSDFEGYRSQVTAVLYLWRCAKRTDADGSPSYTKLAAVTDSSNNPFIYNVPSNDKTKSEYSLTLSDFNTSAGGNVTTGSNLPKYDNSGNEYIYVIKEAMTETPNVPTDPDHYAKSYVNTGEYKTYNDAVYPDGEVDNTLSGTAKLTAEKTWYMAAYADLCKDVSVTVKLQRRISGSTEVTSWENALDEKNQEITTIISGFSAENLTKKASSVFPGTPQYDSNGKPYEFRLVETEITSGTGTVTINSDGTFSLGGHTFKSSSTAVKPTTEDIASNKEIVVNSSNAIADTRPLIITKTWGEGWDETHQPVSINVSIKRKSDRPNSSTENNTTSTATIQSGESWTKTLTVDRYDSYGYEYNYIVTEDSPPSYIDADGTTKPTGHYVTYTEETTGALKANVVNYISGPSFQVGLTKEWKDDGDLEYRGDSVTVKITYSYKYSTYVEYETGAKTYTWHPVENLTKEVNIYKSGNWYTSVGLSIDEYQKETDSTKSYPEFTSCTAEEISINYGSTPVTPVNTEWNGANVPLFTSTNQLYVSKVTNSNSTSTTSRSFTITNTRVGKINVKATKVWQDGKSTTRPDVQLSLYKNSVSDNNKVGTYKLTSVDLVTSTETWSHTFSKYDESGYALDKYDANGVVIPYIITESDPAGATDTLASKDYVSVITEGPYVTGEHHTDDTKNVIITNTRKGTTKFTVTKKWVDAASAGSRPDIYLTLHRIDPTLSDNNEKVYYDYTLTATDSNTWTATFSDLVKYTSDGSEYTYYVTEEMNKAGNYAEYKTYYYDNYNSTSGDATLNDNGHAPNGGMIKNVLEKTFTITGSKIWKNVQTKYLTTLNSYISFSLQRASKGSNGYSEYSDYTSVIDSDAANDKYTFTNLPKYDAEGNLYKYKVKETFNVSGQASTDGKITVGGVILWITQASNDNTLVTNTYTISSDNQRAITVTKAWKYNNIDVTALTSPSLAKMPTVSYTLNRREKGSNEWEKLATATLLPGNTTCTFSGLYRYSPYGKLYEYQVVESSVNGYSAAYAIDGAASATGTSAEITAEGITNTVAFTNSYIENQNTVTLTGTKAWDDYSNKYQSRPDPEKFSFETQPDTTTGGLRLYRYSSNETSTSNGAAAEDITGQLGTDDNATFKLNWTNTDTDTWTYSISNLYEYAPNGVAYSYYVVETPPEQYKQSATVSATTVTSGAGAPYVTMPVMTNSLAKSYSVQKIWGDADDRYGLRPTSVNVELYYSTVLPASATDTDWHPFTDPSDNTKTLSYSLTKADNSLGSAWTHTFTKLPKYEAGTDKLMYYKAVETSMTYTIKTASGTSTSTAKVRAGNDGYQDIGSYTISSNFKDDLTKTKLYNVLLKSSLKVDKIWVDDADDLYDTRPVSDASEPFSTLNPWKITVKLQRTTSDDAEATGALWEDVYKSDGTLYTADISSTHLTEADYTFEDLPSFAITDETKVSPYKYRAVEIAGTDDTTEKLKNYITSESTDYTNQITTVTNALNNTSVTAAKIWEDDSNTKGNRPKSVVFELKYTTDKDTVATRTWHSFITPARVILNGTADTGSNGKNGASYPYYYETTTGDDSTANKWTAKWINLPKNDKSGNALYYEVVEVASSTSSDTTSYSYSDDHIPDGYTVASETTTNTDGTTNWNITNKQTDLEIKKTDAAATDSGLDGAVFTITPKDSSKFVNVADGTTALTVTTAGASNGTGSGLAGVKNQLVAGDVYTFAETTPAHGHVISALTDSYANASLNSDGSLDIKIGTDGKLYYRVADGGTDSDWSTAVTDNQLVIKDKENDITLSKLGADNKALAGAVFTIAGDFVNVSSTEIDTNGNYKRVTDGTTTGENGSITWTSAGSADSGTLLGRMIAGESYTFTETVIPAGYEKINDFKLIMNTDGSVTLDNSTGTTGQVSVVSGTDVTLGPLNNSNAGYTTIPVSISDKQNKVTIAKTDNGSTVTALSGATFVINGIMQGDTGTAATDHSYDFGTVSSKDFTGSFIAEKTYTISETVPPDGYKVITTPFAVKMQNDGQLVFTETDSTNPKIISSDFSNGTAATASGSTVTSTLTLPGTQIEVIITSTLDTSVSPNRYTANTLTVRDEKNTFSINKNAITTEGNVLTTTYLAGAVFTLSAYSSSTFIAGSTTETSRTLDATTASAPLTIDGLLTASTNTTTPEHIYKLSETIPAPGYTVAKDIYLYVDTDGQLYSRVGESGTFSKANSNVLSIEDKKNEIKLTKTDNKDTDATTLKTASFEIAPATTVNSGYKFTDNSTEAKPLPSDGTSFIGELIAGEVYTISETAPPNGYIVSIPSFKVTIDKIGKLTSYLSDTNLPEGVTISNNNIEIGSDATLQGITVKDKKNYFSVKKEGNETYSLDGTSFSLSCVGGTSFANADGSLDSTSTAVTWTISGDGITNNPFGGTSGALEGKLAASKAVNDSTQTPCCTYKLEETTAPDGYKKAAPVYLRMDYSGYLWTSSTEKGTYVPVDGTLAISEKLAPVNELKIKDVRTSVTIRKKNASGDSYVPGATFRLYGKFTNTDMLPDGVTAYDINGTAVTDKTVDANTAYVEWTSTESDITFTGNLIVGNTYELAETKAADGYVITPFDAQFNSAGLNNKRLVLKLSDSDDSEQAGNLYYQSNASPATWLPISDTTVTDTAATKETITVKDAKTELYASKVDTDALSTAVAGATFTVTGIFTDTQSGAATDSKTVVSSSSLLLKDLQTNLEGKLIASTDELDTTHVYTIEETVPTPGYVLPEAGTQTYKIRILSPDAAAANASHPNGVLQYQITDGSNTSWTYVTSSNIGTDVANAVKFSDKKSLVTLDKADADLTTLAVAGAEYSLTGKFASGGTADTEESTLILNSLNDFKTVKESSAVYSSSAITGTSGNTLTGRMIVNNEYKLKEFKPAPGYKSDLLTSVFSDAVTTDNYGKEMTIRVNKYGVLQYKKGIGATDNDWSNVTTGTEGSAVNTSTMTFKDTKTKVSIIKQNSEGTYADQTNVTLTIKAPDSETFATTKAQSISWITGGTETGNSKLLEGELVVGTQYTVTESIPAAGYKAVYPFTITVDEDGKAAVARDTRNTETEISVDNSKTVKNVTIKNNKNVFSVTKTGDTSYSLKGTSFTLTAVETETVLAGTLSPNPWTIAEGSPTNNPYTITGMLAASVQLTDSSATSQANHTYKLEETTPANGYTKVKDIYVRMDIYGFLYTCDSENGSFTRLDTATVISPQNSLNVSDTRTTVSFSKNAEGAVYRLTGKLANMTSGLYPTEVTYTPAADGEEANTAYAKWKSHADSGLTTFTGNLIIDEEYTLTETAAAPGYVITPFNDAYGNYTNAYTTTSTDTDGKTTYTMTIKVGPTGLLYYRTGTGDDGWAQVKDTADTGKTSTTLAFKDKETRLTALKTLTGDTTKAAVGYTEFTVTGKFKDESTSKTLWSKGTSADAGKLTDITGQMIVCDNPDASGAHTYSITETVPTPGYVLPDPNPTIDFYITSAGVLKYKSSNTTSWSSAATAIADNTSDALGGALAFSDARTQATLKKSDSADSQNVANAVYSLTGTFANATHSATDKNKTYTFTSTGTDTGAGLKDPSGKDAASGCMMVNTNLKNNAIDVGTTLAYTYALKETTPAPGYMSDALNKSYTNSTVHNYTDALVTNDAMTVCLDAYGNLCYEKTGNTWGYVSAIETGQTLSDNVLKFYDTQNTLTVSKIDNASNSAVNPNNSVFTIEGTFAGDHGASSTVTSYTLDGEKGYILTSKLIAGEIYTLTESRPADGYTQAAVRYLKVDSNGAITWSATNNDTYSAATNVDGTTLKVPDTKNKLSFAKANADGTITNLTGFTFTVTPVGNAKFAGESTEALTFTNANALEGKLIAYDTDTSLYGHTQYMYKVSETVPPDGYCAVNDFTIKMNYDGTVSIADATDPNKSGTSGTVVLNKANDGSTASNGNILVKDVKTVLKAQKYDTDSSKATPIAGTIFTVKPLETAVFADSATDTAATRTVMTTASGELGNLTGILTASTDTVTYKYSIEETTPSVGYSLPDAIHDDKNDNIWTIRITRNGQLQTLNADGTTWTDVTDNILKAQDPKTTVTIKKTDKSNSATVVSGAQYSLTGTFATKVGATSTETATKTLTSVTNPTLAGYMLANTNFDKTKETFGTGTDTTYTYTLSETHPADGYKCYGLNLDGNYTDAVLTAGAMTICLDAFGNPYYKVTPSKSNDNAYWKAFGSAGSTDLNFVDTQNDIAIAKKGTENQDTTAQAVFSVTGKFTDTAFGSTEVTKTLNSAAIKGKLIVENVYKISETTPPAGYSVVDDFYIKLANDGTIGFVDSAGTAVTQPSYIANPTYDEDKNSTLTITDTQNAVTLSKKSGNDYLEGATFTITGGTFAKDDGSGTVDSDSTDGTTEIDWVTTDTAGNASTKSGTVLTYTGNAITLTGRLIAGQSYTLTETVTPKGYVKINPITVTMGNDGHLTYESTSGNVTIANGVTVVNGTTENSKAPTAAITITNTKNNTVITKEEASGTQLKGATFTFVPVAESTFANDTALTDVTSGLAAITSAGTYTFTGDLVAGNDYTITETVPPDGYKIVADAFTVHMGDDGRLTFKDSTNNVTTTETTDSSNNTVYTSALGTDGYIKITSSVDTAVSPYVYTNKVEIKDVQNSFTIEKNKTTSGTTVTYLKDAHFTLSAVGESNHLAGGTSTSKVLDVTTESAPVLTKGLMIASINTTTPEHVYKLSETTPAPGYISCTDLYLIMDAKGILYYSLTGTDNTWSREAASVLASNNLTITDKQNNVVLKNIDLVDNFKDDATALTTATFKIKPTSSNDKFAGGSNTEINLPSDNTTYLTGKLISGVSYTVTETLPPNGYHLTDGKVTFNVKMDNQGQLSFVSESGSPNTVQIGTKLTDVNGNIVTRITAENEKNQLSVTKTGEAITAGGTPVSLVGASFRLTGTMVPVDTGGAVTPNATLAINAQIDWTIAEPATTNNPYTVLAGRLLSSGEISSSTISPTYLYTLTETAPAPGYTVMDPVYLCLDQYGYLWKSSSSNSGFSRITDTTIANALSVSDSLNSIDIAKNSVTGAGLAGAEFKLEVSNATNGYFIKEDGTEHSTDAITWTSEANAETLKGRLVSGQTYYLSETKAADGYVITPMNDSVNFSGALLVDGTKLQIKVDNNGILYFKTGTEANPVWTQLTEQQTGTNAHTNKQLVITDRPTAFYVAKTDAASGAAVAGTTITLQGTFAGGTGEETRTLTSFGNLDSPVGYIGTVVSGNTSGLIVSTNENDTSHTYVVTETVPTYGYVLPQVNSYTIRLVSPLSTDTTEINQYGILEYLDGNTWKAVSGNSALKATSTQANTMKFTDAFSTAYLKKTDSNNSNLGVAGATYTLDGTFANAEHTATETTSYTFKSEQASTTDTSPKSVGLTDANGNAVSGVMLVNTDFNGSVEAKTYTYKLTETEPAPGYKIDTFRSIYTDANDTTGKTLTLALDGFGNLYYKTDNSTSGTWWQEVSSGVQSGTSLSDNVISHSDTKNGITITKKNASGTATDGAEFEIIGIFAKGDGSGTTEGKIAAPVTKKLISSTNSSKEADVLGKSAGGVWTLNGKLVSLIAGCIYTLNETTPLPGYTNKTGIYFKVNSDGTLSQVNADGAPISGGTGVSGVTISGTSIEVQDDGNSVTLTKNGVSGETNTVALLAGVTFTITGNAENSFANGEGVKDSNVSTVYWVTTDGTEASTTTTTDVAAKTKTITGNAAVLDKLLIAGVTYTFKETATPDGYTKINDFTVKMDNNGELESPSPVVSGEDISRVVLSADKKTITITDTQTSVTITKVFQENLNPDKAALNLEPMTEGEKFADGSIKQSWDATYSSPSKTFTKLFIINTIYKLTETTTPKDYITASPIYLKVDNEGKLMYSADGSSNWKYYDRQTFEYLNNYKFAPITLAEINTKAPVAAALIAIGVVFIFTEEYWRRRRKQKQAEAISKDERNRLNENVSISPAEGRRLHE